MKVLYNFVDKWVAISQLCGYTYECLYSHLCCRLFHLIFLMYTHTAGGGTMPTISDMRIAPKSVLRHLPIGDEASLPYNGEHTSAPNAVAQRASRL